MRLFDFRSDTVTMPTEEMRTVMAKAEVGDAGYGDDPSVNRLQIRGAEILGVEETLFFPSGIMANLTALLTLSTPGSSVVVGQRAHLYQYEAGGLACFAGLTAKPLNDHNGCYSPEDLRNLARPADDVHFPPLTLACLENTHNDCGGTAVSVETTDAICSTAHQMGLAVHLDGARLWNAAVYEQRPISDFVRQVDTVQVCLSKGLGAPMGSLLGGTKEVMARAKFHRKRLGGELRQAGCMAAAALYAIEHNFDRMKEDHQAAAFLSKALSHVGFSVESNERGTNMVYFMLPQTAPEDQVFAERCAQKGVLLNFAGPRRIRLVTHLNVSDMDLDQAVQIFCEVAGV